ncbi:MAG: hypothetical protein V1773_01695 [bacterium]
MQKARTNSFQALLGADPDTSGNLRSSRISGRSNQLNYHKLAITFFSIQSR